jgi:hypothetical protein
MARTTQTTIMSLWSACKSVVKLLILLVSNVVGQVPAQCAVPMDPAGTNYMISDAVTTIVEYAFVHCSDMVSVAIPNSVRSVGPYAFGFCSRLATVVIPTSVTYIGNFAFYLCTNLLSVVMPNTVAFLGNGAFQSCWALSSIRIPDSIAAIASQTFYGCAALSDVVIPNSVTEIGASAFTGCMNLSSVIIPPSVRSIGSNAFFQCMNLASAVISAFAVDIGANAFEDCHCSPCLYTSGATIIDCKVQPTSMAPAGIACTNDDAKEHSSFSRGDVAVYALITMTLLIVVWAGWTWRKLNASYQRIIANAEPRLYATEDGVNGLDVCGDDSGECWADDDSLIHIDDRLEMVQPLAALVAGTPHIAIGLRRPTRHVNYRPASTSDDSWHGNNAAYVGTFYRALGIKHVAGAFNNAADVILQDVIDHNDDNDTDVDEQLITLGAPTN